MKHEFFRLNLWRILDTSLRCDTHSGLAAPQPRRSKTRHGGDSGFRELAAPHPRLIRENRLFGHPSWMPWKTARTAGRAAPNLLAALPFSATRACRAMIEDREVRAHRGG